MAPQPPAVGDAHAQVQDPSSKCESEARPRRRVEPRRVAQPSPPTPPAEPENWAPFLADACLCAAALALAAYVCFRAFGH